MRNGAAAPGRQGIGKRRLTRNGGTERNAGGAGSARAERRRPVFRETPIQAPYRFVGRRDLQYSRIPPH